MGCYGACKETSVLLTVPAICLSLICYGGGHIIAGYMLKDKVMSESNKDFQQLIQNYPENNHMSSIMDRMQEHLRAAGQLTTQTGKRSCS